jgi:phage-related protein (TIGR01555 family)
MFEKLKSFFRGDTAKIPRYNNRTINPKTNYINLTGENVRSDGWMNVLNGLGQRGRDKTTAICFRACPIFSMVELDELYRADGLTKRIIDIVPAEMLRQGFEIDGDPEGEILGKFEELDVNCKLNDLIKWSRLYGGAICVMGIADGRPLNEPVNVESIKSVNWLRVFDRWQVMINYDFISLDINDENYGWPLWYQVTDSRTGALFVVHYSRVLRMDWGSLPPRVRDWNQGWGDSVMVSIYNEVKNYGAAFANTSAIMQDFVNGILKIPGLSNSLGQSCDEADRELMKRLDFANLSKGVTNMMVLDGEEIYEKLSTNVAGISDLLDRFMLSVSSVTGIPITLLFGRAPAGLNATGDADIRNFYDMVKQYQETKLKPVLEKLIYYMFKAEYGPTHGVEPDNWSIQFTPLWQNTEEQEAVMRRTVAETDRIYIETGVLDPNEVAISRFGGDRWSMNTIIDEEAREGGYNQQEIAELEAEKQKEIEKMPPEPTIGPDDLSNSNGGNSVIVVSR